MHGGLFSQDDVTLDDIKNINRNREPPEDGKFLCVCNEVMSVFFFVFDVDRVSDVSLNYR